MEIKEGQIYRLDEGEITYKVISAKEGARLLERGENATEIARDFINSGSLVLKRSPPDNYLRTIYGAPSFLGSGVNYSNKQMFFMHKRYIR